MDEVVTLPSAREIMERLTSVYGGWGTAVGGMYLQIAQKNAGREFTASGIAMMFALAVQDHIPEGELRTYVRSFIPAWVDALVDNKAVAEEAKNIYAAVVAQVQKTPQQAKEVSLEPPITDKRQALAFLTNWLRGQGYEGPVRAWEYFDCTDRTGHYHDFGLLEPNGLFLVYEDGTVKDAYNRFTKKDKT